MSRPDQGTDPTAPGRSDDSRTALRAAALEVFATEGFHASVRQIARRAGLAHGLIRHHFGSREGLRRAVDDWVITRVTEAFEITADHLDDATVAARIERIAAFASDEPIIAAYMGRLMVDDPAAGQPLFDTMASHLREELVALAKIGAAREPVDVDVLAAQIILLELGAVALRPLIEQHLGFSLTSPEGALRWTESAFDLLTHGVYRPTLEPPDPVV